MGLSCRLNREGSSFANNPDGKFGKVLPVGQTGGFSSALKGASD